MDIENGNDEREDEGDNKALPSSQTPPPATVNATKMRRRTMA